MNIQLFIIPLHLPSDVFNPSSRGVGDTPFRAMNHNRLNKIDAVGGARTVWVRIHRTSEDGINRLALIPLDLFRWTTSELRKRSCAVLFGSADHYTAPHYTFPFPRFPAFVSAFPEALKILYNETYLNIVALDSFLDA